MSARAALVAVARPPRRRDEAEALFIGVSGSVSISRCCWRVDRVLALAISVSAAPQTEKSLEGLAVPELVVQRGFLFVAPKVT